jgi:hypothetical protein
VSPSWHRSVNCEYIEYLNVFTGPVERSSVRVYILQNIHQNYTWNWMRPREMFCGHGQSQWDSPPSACRLRVVVQYGEAVDWEPQEKRDSFGVSVGSRYKALKINLCKTWCDLLSLTSLCRGWRDVRVSILVRMFKYELCIKLICQSPILVLVFWACTRNVLITEYFATIR